MEKIDQIKTTAPKAIIIVSACPAGIIGDDVERAAAETAVADCPVAAIKAGGNMAGDYLQGMLMSYTALARAFIERDAPMKENTVNIVFEKVVAKNTNENYEAARGLLAEMGIGINCRFLCETTFDALRGFCGAPINLLAYKDYTGRILQDFFESEFGCRFLKNAFPVGFAETEAWLCEVADFFGTRRVADEIRARAATDYQTGIAALRPVLRGKRLMIITYNHNLDWILKTAIDLEMEIVKLGILNFSQDAGFVTEIDADFDLEENYDKDNRAADIRRCAPDILLSNYEFPMEDEKVVSDTIPMCPDIGFFSGLNLARRWASMLQMDLKGEWRQDEPLFEQYYAR
jgi:nitrogenase molybdenum-iron protein alpha/beta subunit